MGICYIVGAGEADCRFRPAQGDLVIAADAGYRHLCEAAVAPDLIVGDFDSLGSVPEGDNVVRSPAMKDETDMLLAVKLGLGRGYGTFLIYGGLGGRLDHTIANIQTLAYIAEQGGRGFLVGRDENVAVIRGSALEFRPEARGTISVFASGGPAYGVTLRGLRYPLDGATLTTDFPLGVSNEFTGAPARITVKDGLLTVIWTGLFDKTVIL